MLKKNDLQTTILQYFAAPFYEAPQIEIIEIEVEGIIAASNGSTLLGGRYDGDFDAF